jgi:hypothetical protein
LRKLTARFSNLPGFLPLLCTVAFVLIVLSPLAHLFRTQQPWNCFPLTWDESYFIQAIHNWAHGNGYRVHNELKPFGPGTTVGLPMAWGTTAIQKLFRLDWPQAGRLWVHLNAVILLSAFTWIVSSRAKSALAGLVALALLGLCIDKADSGGYLLYGIFGEFPALLLAFAGMQSLNRKRLALAGILAASAYFTKPSFILFLPAVSLAALVFYRAHGLKTAASSLGVLFLGWTGIALQRGESLPEYLGVLFSGSYAIAAAGARHPGFYTLFFCFLGLGFGAIAILFQFGGRLKKTARLLFLDRYPFLPAELAAWIHMGAGALFFLIKGQLPIPKQWFVFYSPVAIFATARLGIWVATRLAKPSWDALLKPVFMTAIVIWVLNVPPLLRQSFRRAEITACSVKEQRHVGQVLLDLQNRGELKAGDLIGVAPFPWHFSVYELGWNPIHYTSWPGTVLPKYVYGDLETTAAAPASCSPIWKGSNLVVLRCQGS